MVEESGNDGEKYISRIKIGDYVAFGKQVKDWCNMDGSERPTTIGAVKKELQANGVDVTFPEDRFEDDTPVRFVESSVKGEWIVRLPPPEMVNESVNRIKKTKKYPVEHLPTYYVEYIKKEKPYDLDFLYSRIADYTIAQCA